MSSPFVLDVRSVPRRAGSMSDVHRTVVTDEPIGVEMIAIPAGNEVDLDLRLESVSEGVLVTGTVSGTTVGQCARCLNEVGGSTSVYLTELFAYPDSTTEQTTDEEDVARIVDEEIDLEQVVIDAFATDLPLAPLCTPDCAGLCPDCGVRLDDAEDGHSHKAIDPRFAGLARRFGSEEFGIDPETAPGDER